MPSGVPKNREFHATGDDADPNPGVGLFSRSVSHDYGFMVMNLWLIKHLRRIHRRNPDLGGGGGGGGGTRLR